MNKVIGILTSTILTTNVVCASQKYDMTGFYIGGNLGYGSGTSHFSAEESKFNSGLRGLNGGFHIGVQKEFKKFVSGIEGNLNLSNSNSTLKIQDDGDCTKISSKRKNSFGIATRLGIIINNLMLYGKAGYENARFSMNIKDEVSSKSKRRLNGFVPGIGFETMLTQNIMFGGELAYAFYKGRNFKYYSDEGRESQKIKSSIGDFKIRLSYKF